MEKELRLFASVCRQPGLFVQSGRYETVCAYIDGYDSALRGGILSGFRYWLLSEGTEWNNLPWWAIVRRHVFPNIDPASALSDSESDEALAALAVYLERYLECIMSNGLVFIFHKYTKWLLARDDEVTLEFRERLVSHCSKAENIGRQD